MTNPLDNSDLASLIQADWHEEFGNIDYANEIREGILEPKINNWHWIDEIRGVDTIDSVSVVGSDDTIEGISVVGSECGTVGGDVGGVGGSVGGGGLGGYGVGGSYTGVGVS